MGTVEEVSAYSRPSPEREKKTPMRVISLSLIVLGAALATTGCSVSTTDNSITFKTQKKHIGAEQSKAAAADYTDQEIQVTNSNGDVIVESDSGTTKVSVTMKPVAYYDDDKIDDARAVQEQVVSTFQLTEGDGKIIISCGQAKSQVGSSGTTTSGCEGLRVKVPTKGVKVAMISRNGSVSANNLTAADGYTLDIRADNGSLNATVTGSAKVFSDNGDVTLNATPTKGSTLSAETGNGDITLSLPSNFAADVIAFSAGDGVKVEGFSDLTDKSTSRGTKGEGAASITAKASSLGSLTVKSR